jgi:hypothetical protein
MRYDAVHHYMDVKHKDMGKFHFPFVAPSTSPNVGKVIIMSVQKSTITHMEKSREHTLSND